MNTTKLALLFLTFVILALSLILIFGNQLFVGPLQQEVAEHTITEVPAPWTTDLSAAHLGVVTFVHGAGDEWRPGVYFRSIQQPGRQAGGPCEVRYDPDIFEKSLAETSNPLVAQIRFAWSLVDCGLSLPENDSLRRRFEANHQPQAYGTWLGEYFDSCGESLYRLGWKFDPETDADLACVPDWKGVVAGYPDGVPGHISRPINVSMDH